MPGRALHRSGRRKRGSGGKLEKLCLWLATADCKSCITLHQDYVNEGFFDVESPCATCFPGVHEYYKAAYILYNDCADQVLIGFGGAVSINMMAADRVMDFYHVHEDERLELHRDIKRIFSKVSKEQHRIQKAKDAAKRKK